MHFLRHVLSFQGKIIISSSSDAVTYFKFELYHWISASKSNRKYLEMSLCMKDARLCFSSFKNRNTRINGDAYIWDWIKIEYSCETSRLQEFRLVPVPGLHQVNRYLLLHMACLPFELIERHWKWPLLESTSIQHWGKKKYGWKLIIDRFSNELIKI